MHLILCQISFLQVPGMEQVLAALSFDILLPISLSFDVLLPIPHLPGQRTLLVLFQSKSNYICACLADTPCFSWAFQKSLPPLCDLYSQGQIALFGCFQKHWLGVQLHLNQHWLNESANAISQTRSHQIHSSFFHICSYI